MPIKVGFIVGKDTDVVEDPQYDLIGDASFLKDMPDIYRVDPESKEYLKNCEEGTTGLAHADVAIPWYIHKHYDDIQVDIIFPEDLTEKRLKSNLINYIVGWDIINAVFEGKEREEEMTEIFKKCPNIVPPYDVQKVIYMKSDYMTRLKELGVPMAPTIFARKDDRSAGSLMAQIKERGWKTFVMKQSYNAFSLGFVKLSVEECEAKPNILEEYFEEYSENPEFVVQEAIEGFTRNWETRVFWWGGEFQYAIANKAAVSTEDGTEVIVTGDDIPAEFLENAKRIGQEALKALPQLYTPNGKPYSWPLMRTDIGCADSQVFDKDTKWDPTQKTFFLNELEYGGTTYFCRRLKFDSIPMWAKLYADKSRELAELMKDSETEEPKAKKARTSGAVLKKPAAAKVAMKRPASAK